MKRIPLAAATIHLTACSIAADSACGGMRAQAPVRVCAGKPGKGLLQFYDFGGSLRRSGARSYMPESNKPKWVIAGLAAALGVVLLIVLAERGPAPQVQIVSVTREDLTASITGNGKVEPISPTVARAEFPTFVGK